MTDPRRGTAWLAVLAVTAIAPAAQAIDHSNLDAGRPVRIEDAYPIAAGELAIEAGAGFTLDRRAPDRGLFQGSLLYGALPNFQLELETEFSTSPGAIESENKSGDLGLSGLYNFNQETLSLPALAAKVSVDFPTGVDSAGVDTQLEAIATKSLGRTSFHLNGSYEFLTGIHHGERRGLYEVALGASRPIGAPMNTRLTLIGDVFTRQSTRSNKSNVEGIELGARYQLTPRSVLDVGGGSEFAGPADRSAFYFKTGLSLAF